MEVQLVNLINSAEKLIKEKKANQIAKIVESKTASPESDKTEFSSSLVSKYLKLQDNINTLQNDLSKEQAKIGILTENRQVSNQELINILFGETPLFRELQTNPELKKEELLSNLQVSKNMLMQSLKSLEVESENILSIAVLKGDFKFSNFGTDLENVKMKELSEKTVERLIKY